MWRALPGILFGLIVAVLLYITYDRAAKPKGQELLGKPAPALHTLPIEGFKPIPSTSVLFKHEFVLVNFFASWCTPCRAEHPYLNQLANEYGLRIVGIAWRDSPQNITAMLKEAGNPYNVVGLDQMDASAYAYGVEGLPESFLIGLDGTVVAAHQGPITPSVIKETLLPFLGQTPAK
jgi:cytochrome c biogenesis protein CcmG, thiol:disulfide interchange protein DsbE